MTSVDRAREILKNVNSAYRSADAAQEAGQETNQNSTHMNAERELENFDAGL